MKPAIQYIIYLIIIVLASSCTDLEEDFQSELMMDIEDLDPPVSIEDPAPPFYAIMREIGLANHGGYYTMQEVSSDEMCIGVKGGDWNSDGMLIRLHQHTYGPEGFYFSSAWNALYGAVYQANQYLEKDTLPAEERLEIRAVRAYFYFSLLDLFGRVKLVTETNPDAPQVSRTEVFEFVEQEWLAALEITTLTPNLDFSNGQLYTGDNPYRLGRYGVLGLLAKLYLNAEVYTGQARYGEAELAASYVINSGRYQLCSTGCLVANLGKRPDVDSDPQLLEGYAAVFAPNNEKNPEHIFAVNFDENLGLGMNFAQMNLHYNSQLTWSLDQQPWNGYSTLEEFYNTYADNDARKKASFLVGPQLDFTGSAILDYAYDDDHPQLDYTPAINELTPNMLRQAGARPAKFSFKMFGRADMDNDFPIVRLGEMYLIRAEAKARQSGNWSDAEADANILRARAGVPVYSGNLTEEEFLMERGREMFQEAARRTDLIRFGRYNDPWWEKTASESFRNLFPIPYDAGWSGDLTQNPGY